MRYLQLIIFFLGFICSVQAQTYWKSYSKKDGLTDSVVVDIAASENAIYIATPQGFSIFKNEAFNNYDTANCILKSQNIKMVKQFNDTAYFLTDSSLVQYFEGQLTLYDTTNGLITKEITDLEINSSGVLYIGSRSGLIIKQGASFTYDLTKDIFDLGINGNDSLYALVNFGTIPITPMPGLSFVEVYDGNAWSQVDFSNLNKNLSDINFISTSSGDIFINAVNNDPLRITNSNNLIEYNVPETYIRRGGLTDIESLDSSIYWFSYHDKSLFNYFHGLIKNDSSKYQHFTPGLPAPQINAIQLTSSKIIIGSENGIAIADKTIQPFSRGFSIENDQLKAEFSYTGLQFTEKSLLSANVGGLEYPKGSNRYTVYSNGLEIHGKDQLNNHYLSRQSVPRNDFVPGGVSTEINPYRPNIIKVTKEQINRHLLNYKSATYEMDSVIRFWPANGFAERGEPADQAPFVDANNNGCYDPENGDFPYILGDEAILIIVNDGIVPALNASTAKTMGIDMHIMAYTFNDRGVEHIDNSVFIKYTIINRDHKTYDLTLSLITDYIIGGSTDDKFGYIPSANIGYAYNATNIDTLSRFNTNTLSYDSILPMMGHKVINSSLISGASIDKFGPDRGVDPPIISDYFTQRMNALWNDRRAFTFGGDGYDLTSTDSVRFLFYGDPRDPAQWSMENNPEVFQGGSDIYIYSSIQPFALKKNERKSIDVVFSVAYDSSKVFDKLGNYDKLINNLNRAAAFQRGIDYIAPEFTYSNCFVGIKETEHQKEAIDLVTIYPNPTSSILYLKSKENMAAIEIYSIEGKLLEQIKIIQNPKMMKIDLGHNYNSGLYLLKVTHENGFTETKSLVVQP